MAAITVTETTSTKLFTDTWEKRRPGAVDNIFKAIPAWLFLYKKGRIRVDTLGGRKITRTLTRSKNATGAWIGRFGAVTLQDTDPRVMCEYEWKRAAWQILIAAWDKTTNAGSERHLNTVVEDIKVMEKSAKEDLNTAIMSATTSGRINGLPDFVDPTPATGTTGGINRANEAWWRNLTGAATVPFSTHGVTQLRDLKRDIEEYSNTPDFHVTTKDIFGMYRDELDPVQRFGPKDAADFGREVLTFDGAHVLWDAQCGSGLWYMLNSESFELVISSEANFRLTKAADLDAAGQPEDQVRYLLFMGQLCNWELRANAVYTGATS